MGSSINAYMVDSVTLRSVSAVNKWGTETTSDTTISCKLYHQTKLLQDERGEDVLAEMKIIMKDRTLDKHKDRIIVDGIEYAIHKIQRPKSWVSTGHIEVWLGQGGGGARS